VKAARLHGLTLKDLEPVMLALYEEVISCFKLGGIYHLNVLDLTFCLHRSHHFFGNFVQCRFERANLLQ
jgi:hypothetical protein